MKEIRQAFDAFWGSLADRSVIPHRVVKAFPVGQVTPPEPPYIVYELCVPRFAEAQDSSVRVWTRSSSFGLLEDILAQIAERVPEKGVRLDLYDKGAIILYRANPFVKYMSPEDCRSAADSPASETMMKAAVVGLRVKGYTHFG